MLPLGDVVTTTITIVLQCNNSQEVLLLKVRIKSHDFIVEIHYAALARKPVILVSVGAELPANKGDVAVIKP